ncbi:MAG: 50S ribosomal protein L19e [Candidatus Hodarchaeota archaeon]
MDLKAQRRMAAKVLKCGTNRVYIDPYLTEDVEVAITIQDIRGLINSGIIRKSYPKGISRSRAKRLHEQKKKGRRSGEGSRKGKIGARTPSKEVWMGKIRPIRAFLKNLRDKKHISTSVYQKYKQLAKGGSFRDVNQMKRYMQDRNVIKDDKKKQKKKGKKK